MGRRMHLPDGYDCKHIYAAMLALEANAQKFNTPDAGGETKPKSKKAPKAKPVQVVEPPVPQPPASPVCVALAKALGRPLNREEAGQIRRVQGLFHQLRSGARFYASSLGELAVMPPDYNWQTIDIWPKFPADDLQFWLYCAWEIQRRGSAIPKTMEPVTDFAAIEPAIREHERKKSIAVWKKQLGDFAGDSANPREEIDFRIALLPEEARIQWKMKAEAAFKDLKQTQFKRFHQDYEHGVLQIVPEASAFWSAIYKPYDYHTATNLDYDRDETEKILNHVLRLPSLADRIVTADGLPVLRSAEVLRYNLNPAQDETQDYRIELVLPDGKPAPDVLLVLAGHPTLYVTQRAVHEGPEPHGFSPKEPLKIPAPALECAEGVNFLQRLKMEFPPRVAGRTKRIAMKVSVTCALKPTYMGSETEAVFIRVTAKNDGADAEHCTAEGWHPMTYHDASPKKRAANDGLIPLIDRSAQKAFPYCLEALGAKFDPYQTSWRVKLTKNFPEVFAPWLASLPPEVEILLDRDLATLRDSPVSGSVTLDVQESGVDWFDLQVALKVSDATLTQEELKLLLNAKGRFVRLGKKGWRRLQIDMTEEDDERLARLGLNARDFTAEPQRLHALQLADDAARKFLPEQQAERIQLRASEIKMRVTPPVPSEIQATLRPYQIEGFHFLSYLTANHFGGVLADDMGLGKTLQTLTWLTWLRNGGIAGNTPPASRPDGKPAHPGPLPSLVVCPKSVMDNWCAEAKRFCGPLRVRLWKGEDAAALEAARAENDLLVLNYSQLRGLSPDIAKHRWQAVILDEAQYIKNPDSQTAQIARTLQADHRLALSGTPIENRLLDLWSIFAFAMPGILGNRATFLRQYNQEDDPFARRRLASRVRPFLLRRAKSQVAQDLPDRIEEDLVCEMEGDQKTLYRAEFKRAQQMLLRVSTQKELNEQRFNFLASLLRLRQICCHPALISNELENAESTKVNALLDLLEPLMEEGHKVIVFSQFVTMLDILRDTIKKREWPHFYLAGETENRGELVAEFQRKKGSAIFLISLKAGGFGLNLTAASYVVLFDPWWNPAVEAQAIDRTHRIGQTSKVIAYRLLIKDSIEQKIRRLQQAKAALANDVLGEEQFAQSLTLDDLRSLFSDDGH